jgi:GNAT superfamily N-acetyltransferase
MKIEEIQVAFSSDPDGFVAHLGEKLGITAIDCEVIHGNQVFDKLVAFLPALLFDYPLLAGKQSTILTGSKYERGYSLRLLNSISLELADGSCIQFGPGNKESIEIIILYVVPAHQRLGIGTYLMYMLFALMSLSDEWPTITINVADQISSGETVVDTCNDVQIRFFKSFGFRAIFKNGKICKFIRPASQEFFGRV